MKVTLVVPTLNEIEGARVFIPRLRELGCDQILVIDGGSTDGTLEYVTEQGCEVVRQSRRGMRAAYVEAYPHIRGDVVVTFSPDGNSLVEAIPLMLARIEEGCDMVIASRYLAGAHSDDDTFLTGGANWAFTKLISLFGFPYTDALVMLRAYRRELPAELGLTHWRGDRYERLMGRYVSWEPQMSIRCAKARRRIAEVPANEPRRVDETGSGLMLPASRISHFRVGFTFLALLLEETVRWRFAPSRAEVEHRDVERRADATLMK